MVVVPLTSNLTKTDFDMIITNDNLEQGNLIVDSMVKINKLFSVEKRLVKKNIGKINKKTFSEIKTILFQFI